MASLAELQAKIEAHVTQAMFAGAAWGVKIVSLDTGRTLYEHAANRRLSPASNTKLYSAALALDQLGADYRMRTPILASATVDAAGELKGNLIVSGRGDPSWDPRRLKQDFMTVYEPFVAVVKKSRGAPDRGRRGGRCDVFSFHAAGWELDGGRHERLLRRRNLGGHRR